MGTQAVIPFRPVRHVIRSRTSQPGRTRTAALPTTFEQALRKGWKVVAEKTVLEADKRHRYGAVALVKEGTTQRLTVAYTASVKAGYTFEKPQLAN